MNQWAKFVAVGLTLLLAVGAWAQSSTESSRPVRGTGQAGQPDSGVLTIQGIIQGRPVTIDFHHTAASALHVVASVGHVSSVTHISGTVRLSDIAGNVVGVTSGGLTVGNIAHMTSVTHVAVTSQVQSSLVTGFRVNCGTGAATAVSPVTGRRDVRMKNVGTVNIYVLGGHVTVTTANGWTLHTASASPGTSQLLLENFQGRMDCIADGPGQTLEIIQILR